MRMHPVSHKYPWHLAAIFIVLVLANISLGYLFYNNQKAHIKRERQEDLLAVADLKASQIATWRKERLADAEHILETSLIVRQVQSWLRHPGSPEVGREIFRWMQSLQRHYRYGSIFLLDAKGECRISSPEDGKTVKPGDRELAEEALKTGKVIFSDLHYSGTTREIRLALAVPLPPPPKGVKTGAAATPPEFFSSGSIPTTSCTPSYSHGPPRAPLRRRCWYVPGGIRWYFSTSSAIKREQSCSFAFPWTRKAFPLQWPYAEKRG